MDSTISLGIDSQADYDTYPFLKIDVSFYSDPPSKQFPGQMNMNIEQTRQQAKDENTAPEILRELAKSEDRLTRQHVAGNPNTPVEILNELGEFFPEALTANPIFNLLLLEKPDRKFLRLALARSSTTSVETLDKLAATEDEDILCAIAINKTTPISVLEKLANSRNERVRYELAVNRNIPLSLLEKIVKKNGSYVCEAVASNPKTPLSILKIIVKQTNWHIRETIATKKAFPEILAKLATDRKIQVRRAVAKNPSTTASILEQLAGENERYIHDAIVEHPNASETAIAIVYFMQGKPDIPTNIIAKLAKDNRLHVRKLVAKHIETPVNILSQLAEEENVRIRKSLIFRTNLAAIAIEKLLETTITQIQRKDIDIRYAKESYIFCLIARHPNVPLSSLETLAFSLSHKISDTTVIHSDRIKKALSTNPKTPLSLLEKLANNSERTT